MDNFIASSFRDSFREAMAKVVLLAVLGCVWLALAASVGHAAPSEANGTCGDDDVTFFPNVAKIKYEGPDSRDPMSFRYYNADEEICVAGKGCKKMRD